jgi:hypothetical protein
MYGLDQSCNVDDTSTWCYLFSPGQLHTNYPVQRDLFIHGPSSCVTSRTELSCDLLHGRNVS